MSDNLKNNLPDDDFIIGKGFEIPEDEIIPTPTKKHKPIVHGIIELSKNNYPTRRFMPCQVYHVMQKTKTMF